MTLPKFILEVQDRENRDRCLQAIRTRYLLILGIWTFVIGTYLITGITFRLVSIHIVLGLTMLGNTFYHYLSRRWQFPLGVVIISTVTDMMDITAIVYFTGGLRSMFFPLYLVQILGVSLFLNIQFSALMVSWAMLLVGAMQILESAGLIAGSSRFIPTTYAEFTNIIIWLVFQAMIFSLVAFLGGNLSHKLKSQERELERKKDLEELYEELRTANKSKTRLLVNVSHNLRTPLTLILGFSELLLNRDTSEPQREEFAKIIHGESQHLACLVNDILYLSQLEAGKVEWHLVETDIAKIVTEAVNSAQGLAAHKRLTLTIDSRATSQLIYGDFSRLTDVMTRLIDNAINSP